jgi:hypothetical protein
MLDLPLDLALDGGGYRHGRSWVQCRRSFKKACVLTILFSQMGLFANPTFSAGILTRARHNPHGRENRNAPGRDLAAEWRESADLAGAGSPPGRFAAIFR